MSEYLWVLNPRGNNGMLPKLSPDQFLKLKQLTVLTLSATNKVLSYNELLEELEICNVHGLEDFLINECVYAAGLPISASATGNMLATSDIVFPLIEEKIDWASKMCQLDMDHQQELQVQAGPLFLGKC
ncbi:PREDICTED: COP9 signalosome complex subunit 7-like isoform X3 [Populus euphratica]|uniref:COP9 signalosome complex subunit 7-like isoform X3 n=1 Tax=Populus euphratica TaxID=75702 RepID=A0AAJ6VG54_POPEU|nr:PREDICTED: COP9 signalosome complex subunit 7-like isoform X3 [Populus euphratica]